LSDLPFQPFFLYRIRRGCTSRNISRIVASIHPFIRFGVPFSRFSLSVAGTSFAEFTFRLIFFTGLESVFRIRVISVVNNGCTGYRIAPGSIGWCGVAGYRFENISFWTECIISRMVRFRNRMFCSVTETDGSVLTSFRHFIENKNEENNSITYLVVCCMVSFGGCGTGKKTTFGCQYLRACG